MFFLTKINTTTLLKYVYQIIKDFIFLSGKIFICIMQAKDKNRSIPGSLKDSQQWLIKRRTFMKNIAVSALFSQLLVFESCLSDEDPFAPLSKDQMNLLIKIQDILFPKDDYGPGASDFKADKYILWILNDKRMDPEENEFIVKGINWTEEKAQEDYGRSFLKLVPEEQIELVAEINKESWGESWLSLNLTYIFEAMISDPIYGFNEFEEGWKWLEHLAGSPRPDERTMYDQIFNSLKQS